MSEIGRASQQKRRRVYAESSKQLVTKREEISLRAATMGKDPERERERETWPH